MTIFLGPFLDTFVEIGATLALWRAARRRQQLVGRPIDSQTIGRPRGPVWLHVRPFGPASALAVTE